jgi:hypothetical protein
MDLTKRNWVQLQQALYDARRQHDAPETRTEGRRRILAVYAEYARRGVTKVAKPRLR